MTTPEQVAARLTQAQKRAVIEFVPGRWYEPTRPSRAASFCKGRLCEAGILEHDGRAPASSYRLTRLGQKVRALLQEPTHER